MITSFYTAATGTIQLQKGIDVAANNIANVDTTGYKATEPTFSDLLYTNIHAAPNTQTDLKNGHGTKLAKTDTVFTQGGLKQTGQMMDYALTQPNEFFAVQTGGTIKYTRNGNFHISEENGLKYVVDSTGGYVLGANGQRITVNSETDDVPAAVYSFPDCDGLSREGNSYFTATDRSGAATWVENPAVKKGWLEESSANLSTELTSVMELQRAFQMNSKIVQMSDEIMQTVNNLR